MNFKLLYVIIFIGFISLPTIQYIYPFITIEKVDEKRKKEVLPSGNIVKKIYKDPATSITVEKYFSDHFSLRDVLLRLNAQFEYSVLNRAREVVIGKNGWLCDKKVFVEQLPKLDKMSNEDVKKGVIKLKKLQYYLQTKGIKFLIVVIPMKATVYPEMFPSRYTKRPKLTTLQRFQNSLKNNGIEYIDALSILNNKKLEEDVYFKTDMHFNSVGSSYIAEAIVNHFSNDLLKKDLWNEPINKSKILFSGGSAKNMPTLIEISENTPLWQAKNNNWINFMYDKNKKVAPFGAHKTLDTHRTLLPPSIMFGNSFMLRYPSVGYQNNFSISYNILDYSFFKNALDYIKPQHKSFILHVYETQLLFHLLDKLDGFNYWDKRIDKLPLPSDFIYKYSKEGH
jgi:hypothetical protein